MTIIQGSQDRSMQNLKKVRFLLGLPLGSQGPIATPSPSEMPKRHAGIKPASPLLPASPDPSTREKTNLGRPSAETLHTGKVEASHAQVARRKGSQINSSTKGP